MSGLAGRREGMGRRVAWDEAHIDQASTWCGRTHGLRNCGAPTSARPSNSNPQPRLQSASAKVRIFQPSRSAVQGGRADTRDWILEFERRSAPFIDPLMGWTGSRDTLRQVRLKFPTREQAIAFAEGQGWAYSVGAPKRNDRRPMRSSDRVNTGDATAATASTTEIERPAQSSPQWRPRHPQVRTASVAAAPPSTVGCRSTVDPVDVASDQSFPASDPPAWIGSAIR